MIKTSHPLDRSVAFSALLNLSPEFGRMETRDGSTVISMLLEAWEQSNDTDLYEFTRQWLETHKVEGAL